MNTRAFGCALLASCTSCIWLPLHGQVTEAPNAIPAEAIARLVPGSSTRADVLCELGAPEWAAADGARMVYATREVHSFFFLYLAVDAATLFWGEDRYLLCEFEATGVLRERREVVREYSEERATSAPVDDARCEKLFRTPSR